MLSSFFQNHQSDITSPPLWRSPNNYCFLLSPFERSKAAFLVLRLELVYWRITKNFQEVLLSQFLELQLPFVFLEICLPEKNISVLQILLKYFPVLKQTKDLFLHPGECNHDTLPQGVKTLKLGKTF